MEGPNGAASAMKLSYAGITKEGLYRHRRRHDASARHAVARRMRCCRRCPRASRCCSTGCVGFADRMPPKAYRWVAEMEEISKFQEADPAARDMYLGIAMVYEQIAAALDAPKAGDAVAQLQAFCAEPEKRKTA